MSEVEDEVKKEFGLNARLEGERKLRLDAGRLRICDRAYLSPGSPELLQPGRALG